MVPGYWMVTNHDALHSGSANQVSANVYLGVGVVLFIAALVAVFVMYIFFIICELLAFSRNTFSSLIIIREIRIERVSRKNCQWITAGLLLYSNTHNLLAIHHLTVFSASGKKKKADLGFMGCLVCKCCEPKEPPVGKYQHLVQDTRWEHFLTSLLP